MAKIIKRYETYHLGEIDKTCVFYPTTRVRILQELLSIYSDDKTEGSKNKMANIERANIEHANRWNEIIKRCYEIELNPENSLIKRSYARKYEGFAVAMCRMYCNKAVYGKEA